MTFRLKAPTVDYVKPAFLPDDPKELYSFE